MCRHYTHSQHSSVQYSLFTSAERTAPAWLKSHGLQRHLCAPEKGLSSGPHMSHPLLLLSYLPHHEHIIFLIQSSFYHHTRTRTTIWTTRSTQEYPVHHQPLQEHRVDKLRYQESLWRENQQRGGNPRKTFSTRCVDVVLCRPLGGFGRGPFLVAL